jgi:hypothetical protein
MATPRFKCSMAGSICPALYAAMPSVRALSASADRYSGSRPGSAGPSLLRVQEPLDGLDDSVDSEGLLEVRLDAVVCLQIFGDAPALGRRRSP